MLKKLTKDQALAEKKEIIGCLKNQRRDLRRILAKAKLNEGYKLLGFNNFNAFINKCIDEAGVDISSDYARKHANAGIVEMVLFGEDEIGKMREAPLRIFYENIDKDNWKRVYELAKKSCGKVVQPTAKKIIIAAKSLHVLKKKVQEKPNTKSDEKNVEKSGKKSLTESKTANDAEKSIINIEPIDNEIKSKNPLPKVAKPLNSSKACAHLIKVYKPVDIRKILGFLRVSKDDKIQHSCNHILNNCTSKSVNILIKKLSNYVKTEMVS